MCPQSIETPIITPICNVPCSVLLTNRGVPIIITVALIVLPSQIQPHPYQRVRPFRDI